MSDLDWLLRGGSMDASAGVVLPGVHLAERIEALGRRVLAELRASCPHQHIQAIHAVGRVGLEGTWRCTRCGLEGTWGELTSLAIQRAYRLTPEELGGLERSTRTSLEVEQRWGGR